MIALADEGLLAFDSVAAVWAWDINRIRAKNYTDNVVDLMVRKLKRLSITTQDALKRFACLGNVAEIGTLSLDSKRNRTGNACGALGSRPRWSGRSCRVTSTNSCMTESSKRRIHCFLKSAAPPFICHIGRKLLASMTADKLTEQLFEVANQFNRGAALIVDWDEKSGVATINLRAGRKAKASAAYASALAYFATGTALVDERDWTSRHELTFSLWLERAQCELLNGNFETAALLIVELLQRAASNIELRGRLRA